MISKRAAIQSALRTGAILLALTFPRTGHGDVLENIFDRLGGQTSLNRQSEAIDAIEIALHQNRPRKAIAIFRSFCRSETRKPLSYPAPTDATTHLEPPWQKLLENSLSYGSFRTLRPSLAFLNAVPDEGYPVRFEYPLGSLAYDIKTLPDETTSLIGLSQIKTRHELIAAFPDEVRPLGYSIISAWLANRIYTDSWPRASLLEPREFQAAFAWVRTEDLSPVAESAILAGLEANRSAERLARPHRPLREWNWEAIDANLTPLFENESVPLLARVALGERFLEFCPALCNSPRFIALVLDQHDRAVSDFGDSPIHYGRYEIHNACRSALVNQAAKDAVRPRLLHWMETAADPTEYFPKPVLDQNIVEESATLANLLGEAESARLFMAKHLRPFMRNDPDVITALIELQLLDTALAQLPTGPESFTSWRGGEVTPALASSLPAFIESIPSPAVKLRFQGECIPRLLDTTRFDQEATFEMESFLRETLSDLSVVTELSTPEQIKFWGNLGERTDLLPIYAEAFSRHQPDESIARVYDWTAFEDNFFWQHHYFIATRFGAAYYEGRWDDALDQIEQIRAYKPARSSNAVKEELIRVSIEQVIPQLVDDLSPSRTRSIEQVARFWAILQPHVRRIGESSDQSLRLIEAAVDLTRRASSNDFVADTAEKQIPNRNVKESPPRPATEKNTEPTTMTSASAEVLFKVSALDRNWNNLPRGSDDRQLAFQAAFPPSEASLDELFNQGLAESLIPHILHRDDLSTLLGNQSSLDPGTAFIAAFLLIDANWEIDSERALALHRQLREAYDLFDPEWQTETRERLIEWLEIQTQFRAGDIGVAEQRLSEIDWSTTPQLTPLINRLEGTSKN
ncbi:MAG: hypothetical protein AAF236_02965 [Verrucomicrobiota bacterium]